MTSVRTTVVFDLDDTLTRGDIGAALIRWLLRRNPLRWLAALLASPVLAPGLLLTPTRRLAASGYLWLATAGLRRGRFDDLLARFIASYPLRPIDTALMALHEEISRGHQVVIATGAFEPLADGLLRRLAIRDQIALVGSQTQRWAGGLVLRIHCNGMQKVRQLHDQGFPAPYLRAYSDSWHDHPLLDLADYPVLVNANPLIRRRMRQRYGKQLRIVIWN